LDCLVGRFAILYGLNNDPCKSSAVGAGRVFDTALRHLHTAAASTALFTENLENVSLLLGCQAG
jgi:hypothetical protein